MSNRRYATVKKESTDKPAEWSGPTIYLPLSSIPEAKGWEVGKKYEIELQVEQESISKDSVTFSVKGVKTK